MLKKLHRHIIRSEGAPPPVDERMVARLTEKLRASVRIDQRNDLPAFRQVITNQLRISGDDLSALAALDLGNKRAALLVTESAIGGTLYLSVRHKIAAMGYAITVENLASTALIVQLNDAVGGSAGVQRSSTVEPLVREMITDALRADATDIHLVVREESCMVLLRVHGHVRRYRQFTPAIIEEAAGYLYTVMAEDKSRSHTTFNLEAKSMNCVIRMDVDDVALKLRYQYVRASDGWDVIIRLLRIDLAGGRSRSLVELGYASTQVKQLEMAAARTVGEIVIAGITGSGKSTTLKTLMEVDPHRMAKKRYSIEDPVEYKIFGVTQISVQRDTHSDSDEGRVSFAGAMAALLRADPDAVMVGEIRDADTADLCATLVQTGHQVYSTLHTSSAISIIGRLARLGVERHILADRYFLSALVYQRLLPVLCSACKEPASQVLPESMQRLIADKFGLDSDHTYCMHEGGCPNCRGQGVVGQTVCAEVITPDQTFREHIAAGRDDQAEAYWRATRHSGFNDEDMTGKTAFEHALYKMSQGLIDPREVESSFEPFLMYEVAGMRR